MKVGKAFATLALALGGLSGTALALPQPLLQYTFSNSSLANTGSTGSTNDGTFVGTNTAGSNYSTDTPGGTGQSVVLGTASATAGDLYGIRVNNTSNGEASYTNTFDGGLSTGFTISLWEKRPTAAFTGDAYQVFFQKGQNDAVSYRIRRNATDTTGKLIANMSTSVSSGATAFNNGGWHFLALTYDGTTMKEYLDNTTTPIVSTAATFPTAGTPAEATRALLFGVQDAGGADARNPTLARPMNGLMYGINVFDQAASTTDLAALKTSSQVPEPASIGLLAVGSLALLARRRRA